MTRGGVYRASSGMVPVAGQHVLLTPLCSERVHREVLARVDKVVPQSSIPGYVYLDVREVLDRDHLGPPLVRLLVNVAGLVLYPVASPPTSGNTPSAT